MALRRDMVVEQALRDVQVAIARHVQLIQSAAEGFEVVGRRLVGTDVFGGDDLVELHAEALSC